MVSSTLITVTFTVCLFAVHHVYTHPGGHGTKRILTAEEQILADDARNHIANVLEQNLIKFFTLVAADDGRGPFARQQDDDEDTTLNPNTLPQVAQILGAIFAGNFNLTSIVDRTFSLVPDVLRNQVDGLFKLLTGQQATTTTTTAKPRRKPVRKITTTTTQETEPPTTTSQSLIKNRYKVVKPKNTTSPLSPDAIVINEDDELIKLEDEVVNAAIDAEPYVQSRLQKEPRFILGSVREILAGFDRGRLNMTQVIKFLPDLFIGARQAFTLLESLGQLAEDVDDD